MSVAVTNVEAPAVAIKDLSFSYNGLPVLDDVNMVVNQKDFLCVLGPNGGGKTTLLKLMLGLIKPARGTVKVFGESPDKMRPHLGYVPQHWRLDLEFPVRVRNVVLMGRMRPSKWIGSYGREDRAAAMRALDEVNMADLHARPFAELSGGQRQRVLIARALAVEPRILLLDEPTAHVDAAVEAEIHALLQKLHLRMAVVMVTHDLGFVSPSVTSVVCVKHKVVVHKTHEITADIIKEIYGHDVRVVCHSDHCHDRHT